MSDKKKLSLSITTLILLCICLSVTSFALAYTVFEVNNNVFKTGGIEIDLNGGKPIITEDEYLFEPGMTVEKEFYVQNNGTWAVYCKLYFSEVKGTLGDILEAKIIDENGNIVAEGKLSELTQGSVSPIESELEVGERKNLKMQLHFPEEAGNDFQGESLTFEFSAVAVQTKNNPDKEFE